MKIIYLSLIFCFYAGLASSQTISDTLTNEKVLSLINSGLPASVIITKIQTSITKFDVTTDDLIKLKTEGVPDEIINVMINPNSSDANLKASNDGTSICKKWVMVSRTINGASEVKSADVKVQYFENGTFTSIYIDIKTNKKFESGGKFELSADKKNIKYLMDNSEPVNEQIIKLTDKELETKCTIQGKVYDSSFVVDQY